MTAPDASLAGGSLPTVRSRLTRRELLLIAAFWSLFALLTVANRLVGAGGLWPGAPSATGPVVIALAESLCWALLTPAVFWLASRAEAEPHGQSPVLRAALLVVLGIVAAALVTLIGHELRGVFGGWSGRGARRGGGGFGALGGGRGGRHGPPWFAFANSLLIYLGIYAAGLARAYSLRARARQEQAARLQAQLAEARLDALRRQLDPHFLFNTLNAVSALVERDPRGVRRMIARLSELLRHSFEGGSEPEVPLRDELALLGRYVEIMQLRFQGRLTVETRTDARALDALVPNMVLQPLVENAIKHGVERLTRPGHITVDAAVEGDVVVLRVFDDGPGVEAHGGAPTDVRPDGGGVGLRNTVARLEQLYGAAHRFTLASGEEGGAVAEIRLPFRTRTSRASAADARGGAPAAAGREVAHVG